MKGVQQLNRFMNLPQEIIPEARQRLNSHLAGDVQFSGVSMKLASDPHPTLVNVSFEAKRGEILVVCGHGGIDGINVCDALMRLKDIQSGGISIDGMNIRQFDALILRQSISLVPEKTQLFEITLMANLRLANPAATQEDIDRVIDMARIKRDLDMLPDGLETVVTGQEGQFSESFLKRFSFARAWLRDVEIQLYQLLDKGLTKSRILDLQASLLQMKATRTIIVVSNNPDLFEIGDQAIWLDQGKVMTQGPAAEVFQRFYSSS